MIRPSKHAHPDLTVMSVATVILERLKTKRTETYADLVILVEKRTKNAKTLLLPALNLLFMLGLIRYLPKADRFEYLVQS
ncbi:ABC-three component system middle component 8 [Loktanella sp. M215]|uniref:ABC-three component system middle component 8 n=1 Tax=Loktanella sp. M215 TaxID=2675431 RepID=UPI001F344C71|nr:ABC-three component system middle component 8 [Loktanella sp. M215]MBU2357888.1 hypothetical protein [Alphaproteobacteria bacterium]MCF7702060.1 hypothetical protein [Loktanella sp. M215]